MAARAWRRGIAEWARVAGGRERVRGGAAATTAGVCLGGECVGGRSDDNLTYPARASRSAAEWRSG